MSLYRRTFPKQHTFLAVIHVEGGKQALRNARIAFEEGADGIFLINHRISYTQLLECQEHVQSNIPELWIGLNCLDIGRAAVCMIPRSTKGLWVDDAGVIEDASAEQMEASMFTIERNVSGWVGIYFGGVAFKYQRPVNDVGRAAKEAILHVDVITTSGDGTGIAANVEKIRKMKVGAGKHPLAIASGITPENVADYMPYADCFLVATGVSDSHTELNPQKVRALVKRLKEG